MKQFKYSGLYLKKVRQEAGVTQMQLAEKSGHHSQIYSNAERGICTLPAECLRAFKKLVPGFDPTIFVSMLSADAAAKLEAKYKKVFKK